MNKNILFLLLVAGYVYAATLGGISLTTDVATTAEMEEFTSDPAALQAQITSNATAIALLADGITTNYVIAADDQLNITNGVVKGLE